MNPKKQDVPARKPIIPSAIAVILVIAGLVLIFQGRTSPANTIFEGPLGFKVTTDEIGFLLVVLGVIIILVKGKDIWMVLRPTTTGLP